ncbi:GTPase-activating protein and VPS9 domain-containing protein 1-like [Lycorma delicatula]|uniref:GTPase-activating protein and VPS9 domain-containing protein 1-like n=1 Tax=Lycorma delicatula TaxID=130591 RepID=UPI003F51AB8F
MNKLSKVITPSHKDLQIPKMYYYECPWPSAQADIAAISAYKTPRDKLYCVFHCCTTTMNLLSLASDRSVPASYTSCSVCSHQGKSSFSFINHSVY